ncbi:MAG: DUF599 domain-containing protein [Betaproteobacteria bacterium]|nr:DUF599 domain-containing protein [Betaproteobacteria bacterium]NBY09090.1 DUF599 domain-containing protein [Betaproteobacteria bacterium]
MKILSLLPWLDWLALVFFASAWVGYAQFSNRWASRRPSILAATNRFRLRWMQMSLSREPRVLDGIITQSLSNTPTFFSSTTILIIGGLLALMGTTDKAAELVREIPFSQPTPILIFELKIIVLITIFVYAFFRFSWSMRQYTWVALMIGALPPPEFFQFNPDSKNDYAGRVATMTGLAAETFNDGLRSYYFSFAVMGWFFSPIAFVVTTLLIVAILYNREFQSDVLDVLNDGK